MCVRVIVTLTLLAALLVTSGCNGSRELDEVANVLTIGVDVGEGDQLDFTYRVAIPRALAAGDGGGGKADKSKTSRLITVRAPTLAEGRNLLNSSVSRAVTLSHVTGLVIGEDLARKGLADFLAPTMRFREFRGSIYVVVVTGKAKDLMQKNDPEEMTASRWIEALMSTADESGYYLKTTLHDFYIRLKSKSGSPYAVLMGINPLNEDGQQIGPDNPGDKTRNYFPKDLPREKGNPATVIGTAVFKKDKMVGMLSSQETRMLAMLLGGHPRGYIMVVDDPLTPKRPVNTIVRPGRKPEIHVDIQDGQAFININVFLESEITSISSGIQYETKEYRGLLEQQISQTVRQRMLQMLRHTQGWGADVVDFGYYLRPQYATDQEFKNLHWDKLYQKAEFNVVVNTAVRRTGLMKKTSPIRTEEE